MAALLAGADPWGDTSPGTSTLTAQGLADALAPFRLSGPPAVRILENVHAVAKVVDLSKVRSKGRYRRRLAAGIPNRNAKLRYEPAAYRLDTYTIVARPALAAAMKERCND
jgi:hypothetical protein